MVRENPASGRRVTFDGRGHTPCPVHALRHVKRARRWRLCRSIPARLLATLFLLPVGLTQATKSLAAETGANTPRLSLPLDGPWQFRLDPKNEGTAAGWFKAGAVFPDAIRVPGNWQAQGFGPASGITRHDYQGKAWYRRTVRVPETWAGRRVWLRFEGVCNWGIAYVNGRRVGRIETFIVPYEFDATDAIRFGAGEHGLRHGRLRAAL